MPTGSNSTSTSPTRLCSNNSNNSNNVNGATDRKNSLDSTSSCSSGGGGKLATMSYDPTPYIQRARVTRPAPPKPSCNPMQFVQIKPCNLYQTAQEQLKKAEEVKKVKEIKKEEPEDWQSNLDNWKSSRRKRVEHIIDRVVEVKKLELEEHDRTRKKSKTFSEMLEERSSRRTKLSSLAVYTEDESNDLSDFGIGTNSISGKSSLSEDYDNNSVMSDNIDTEKPMMSNHHNHLDHENGISSNRDYNITTSSSPGYETTSSSLSSSSTSAPPTANSPDPLCEYTYEGAIQDYKTRVSKTQSNNNYNNSNNTGSNNNRNTTAATTVSSPYSKDSTPEMNFTPRRPSGSKIENRLMNFEIKSSSPSSSSNDLQTNELINIPKKDLPKVDILKRRELFEKDTDMLSENINSNNNVNNISNSNQKKLSGDFTNTKSIRERLSSLEKKPTQANEVENKKMNRLSGDITSLKDRLQYLERQTSVTEKSSKIDVPVVPLKERLSSLQNAVQKEEIKKPVLLVDEHQLEILKKEDLEKQHTLRKEMLDDENLSSSQEILNLQDESIVDTDREDSGIHTTDVSCSVSQTDEQPDLVNDESHHHINAEDGLCQNIERKLQKTGRIHEEKCEDVNPSTSSCIPDVIRSSATEQKSNEEQQQDQHEHNQQQQQEHQTSPIIENDNNMNAMSPEPINDQEASVEEALEMALRAIDNENLNNNDNDNKNDNNQSCNPIKNVIIKEEHNENETDINQENVINNESDNNLKNFKELLSNCNNNNEPIYQNLNELIQNNDVGGNDEENPNKIKALNKISPSLSSAKLTNQTTNVHQWQQQQQRISLNGMRNDNDNNDEDDDEPYYQVPKSSEPLYEVPKYQKPVPVYENIEIFYSNMNSDDLGGIDENYSLNNTTSSAITMEPPKEKPPPPPIDDENNDDNEYENGISVENGDDYNDKITTKTTTTTVIKQNVLLIKQKNHDNQHEQQQQQQQQEQEQEQINNDQSLNNKDTSSPNKNGQSVKRMNSTKRIKKELRNKRSSFLGIESNNNDDDIYLELTVAPPPDMAQLLQEERRLEKQLYMKAGLYDSSDTGDSRDSGVSENHSRQSSEPFTNSSEEHEDLLIKKEKEIIEVLEKEEKKQKTSENWVQQQQHQYQQQQQQQDNNAKIQCIEDQIREQEEVLRVERELLQLEQEELKRQRENLIIRENLARKELEYGAKMLMSANHHNTRSLQDINNASSMSTVTTPTKTVGTGNTTIVSATNHYANVPNRIYQVDADYRKSMSDLPTSDQLNQKRIPPAPPAKPLRSLNLNANNVGLVKIANSNNGGLTPRIIHHSQSTDEFVPLRNYQQTSALHHGNMTRHTLLALSATPKPKYTDGWVQSTTMASSKNKSLSSDKSIDNWLSYQQKRKSIPDGFNYSKHWLIQEAEQRRIDQQRALGNINTNSNTNHLRSNKNSNNSNTNNNGGSSSAIQKNLDNKPLPDAVIQTITQRIQSKGLGERKRLDQPPPPPPTQIAKTNDSLLTTVTTTPPISAPSMNPLSLMLPDGQQEKILSVSGKKKCSHCGEELGRGAAMIIESLRLFYHINCFKCCVCHVQLGDGLNGTDVRVRNQKLHCHNCYSSDDGIKFSCV